MKVNFACMSECNLSVRVYSKCMHVHVICVHSYMSKYILYIYACNI